jgi:hypothetical protein
MDNNAWLPSPDQSINLGPSKPLGGPKVAIG